MNNDWHTRSESHKANLLTILRERGERGVESAELYSDPQRYGFSPRNRASELRKEGYQIKTIHLSSGLVRYILTGELRERAPMPDADAQPQFHRTMSAARRSPGSWKPRPVVPSRPTTSGTLFDVSVDPR
ncbi:MAG: hypothetical protein WA542_19245 [Candidatus Acidiferrum sp.]